MKVCIRCREEKPIHQFHKARKNKDGFRGSCKICEKRSTKPSTGVTTSVLRLEALSVLGGPCVECGFLDVRALQIDHINGGGTQERKKKGGARAIYVKIARGNTDGYQVLCANCNWIKRVVLNEGAN